MRNIAAALVLVAALATGATPVQGDIVTNGSFELGTGSDAANWNQIEIAGGTATAQTIRDSSMPNTGSQAVLLDVVGAVGFGPVAEIQQQTAVGSVTAGTAYDFSFFTTGSLGPGSVAFYEVLWFDGDGSAGGGPQGSATGLQNYSSSVGSSYGQVTDLGLVAPAGADSVLIQIRLVTGAFDGAAGNVFVDDVSFSEAIPEPGSAALLAGLLGLIALRRRR